MKVWEGGNSLPNSEDAWVPRRVSYNLFSREISAKSASVNIHCRDELRRLRDQLRAAKLQRNEEQIVALKQEITGLKQLRLKNRNETRQTRCLVKKQLRELRARHRGWQGLSEEAPISADPWQARLPNMHKLFPATNSLLRSKVQSEVSSVLSQFVEDPLSRLLDLIDNYMVEACPQPHVIDFCVMDALINAIGDHLPVVLQLLTRHSELFARSVLESDHHDLFEKIVLMVGKRNGWKLRMHVFIPDNFMIAQEEVHSHRNHFTSRIMYGGFAHEIWETIQPSTTADLGSAPGVFKLNKYIYDPLLVEGARVFNLEPCGEIYLRKLAEVPVMRGTSYYMHTSVLHAVSSICGCTVTVVLNAPQTNPTSCFATYQPWDEETFERKGFTDEELRAQIGHVLELLSKVGDAPVEQSFNFARAAMRE